MLRDALPVRECLTIVPLVMPVPVHTMTESEVWRRNDGADNMDDIDGHGFLETGRRSLSDDTVDTDDMDTVSGGRNVPDFKKGTEDIIDPKWYLQIGRWN